MRSSGDAAEIVIGPLNVGVPATVPLSVGELRVLLERVRVLEAVAIVTPPTCPTPVPLGTRFTLPFVSSLTIRTELLSTNWIYPLRVPSAAYQLRYGLAKRGPLDPDVNSAAALKDHDPLIVGEPATVPLSVGLDRVLFDSVWAELIVGTATPADVMAPPKEAASVERLKESAVPLYACASVNAKMDKGEPAFEPLSAVESSPIDHRAAPLLMK